MCQNSFIKQYLAKQQELLRQRLEREAQEEDDADGRIFLQTRIIAKQIGNTFGDCKHCTLLLPFLIESPAGPEEDEDHSEDNDSSSYVPDKVSNL